VAGEPPGAEEEKEVGTSKATGGEAMNLLELPAGSFYDVVTALRGPDFLSCTLKFLVTSRIRYWVSKLFGVPMFGDIRDEELTLDLIYDANLSAKYFSTTACDMYWHYADHTIKALDVLCNYLEEQDLKEAKFLRWCLAHPKEDWRTHLLNGVEDD
jgi:hypothetical protein